MGRYCTETVTRILFFVALSIIFPVATLCQGQTVLTEGIYPQGKRFPLGLYASNGGGGVTASGFNVCHTYTQTPVTWEFVNECRNNGVLTHGRLKALGNQSNGYSAVGPAEFRWTMKRLHIAAPGIAWWDLPEEMRYWYPSEMNIVKTYSIWTRRYDPLKRPNYMYIPSHYDTADVRRYVPYLDIVPASCYTTWADQPHAWVRWRMESTVDAIRLEQKNIGPNYLAGEKTPVAVLELFDTENPVRRLSAAGSYHDFWSAVASGAHGIFIYSYFYRNLNPDTQAAWGSLQTAASRLTANNEELGQMILRGTQNQNVSFTILSGPPRTPSFTPHGAPAAMDFPSINILAKEWNGYFYLIAVNSATEPIRARIAGLPNGQATVMFESRSVNVSGGAFSDSFDALGVRIYKLAVQ